MKRLFFSFTDTNRRHHSKQNHIPVPLFLTLCLFLFALPATPLQFFSENSEAKLYAEQPSENEETETINTEEEPAEEEQTEPARETVIEVLRKGGITMIGLALISTIIIAFSLERALFFRRQRVQTKGYFDKIKSAMDEGGLDTVEKTIQDDPLLLSRILKEGLGHRSQGRSRVERAIESTASVEIGKLEKGLNLLSNLGNLAPLLGFFGTVVGMRTSFLQFVEKAAPTARDLAIGVEEALITTATGLAIAIPTYLIYNLFIYYIDSLTIELERSATLITEDLEK